MRRRGSAADLREPSGAHLGRLRGPARPRPAGLPGDIGALACLDGAVQGKSGCDTDGSSVRAMRPLDETVLRSPAVRLGAG